MGRLAAASTRITQHDMYLAAVALSEQVTPEELSVGSLYPSLERIRDVSAHIAVAVANNAYKTGLATNHKAPDMLVHVKSLMYDPFNIRV